MKQKKLDFLLSEDKDWRRVIFRFYPRSSHLHSFNESLATDWKGVYKVYYSWAILQSFYNSPSAPAAPASPVSSTAPVSPASGESDGSKGGYWEAYETVFKMEFDECSAITELEYHIRHVFRYRKKKHRLCTWGQPGSDWTLEFHSGEELHWRTEDADHEDWIHFTVFNNCTNCGYQFDLWRSDAMRFVEYLHAVNEHMLANGQPI